MKKLYSLIFTLAFALLSISSNATTFTVNVANNSFTPNNFNAVIGDIVTWHLIAGTHTATSVSVPTGAAIWDSGTLTSTDYSYTITTAGNYVYWCTFHGPGGMGGGFVVTATGIIEPATNLITNAYPNPFNDKITFKYNGINGIQSLEVFNVIGDKVKAMELSANETKTEIDFAGFPAGIYFYRTYNKEGTIVETRKIVKAN